MDRENENAADRVGEPDGDLHRDHDDQLGKRIDSILSEMPSTLQGLQGVLLLREIEIGHRHRKDLGDVAARNVACADFVAQLHEQFQFKAIALVGIAGGNRDKVKIGDVVASTEILDDEGGVDFPPYEIPIGGGYRFGFRRVQPRVRIFDHAGHLANLLNAFPVQRNAWIDSIREVMRDGNHRALKFADSDMQEEPDYHHRS